MEVELFSNAAWRILWLGRVDYAPVLARQEGVVVEKIAHPGVTPDTLLLLEHEPVYTIGRTQDRSSLVATEKLAYPVETIHRGGQATYHGPGQLVGYPIVDLSRRVRDLHRYLRALEDVLVMTLARHGIRGCRRPNLTGVWVGEQKIASIGVGVRRWVTLHGFALNVSRESLEPFQAIIPCGIEGVSMTVTELHSATATDVARMAVTVAELLPLVMDERLPVDRLP